MRRAAPAVVGALALPAALTLLSVLPVAVAVAAAAPAAAQPVACSELDSQEVTRTTSTNAAFRAMDVAGAQAGVDATGQVIGVVGAPMADQRAYLPTLSTTGTTSDQDSEEPTAVAGLAAGTGSVGVAPGARVVGVGVFDPSADNAVVTADDIATGITTAVGAGARVVVVAVAAGDTSSRLETAVRSATARGALVVASVQPPTTSRDDAPTGSITSYPAALHGVLGVGLDPGDGAETAPSADLDVVAPQVGAVITTANGSLCDVDAQTALASYAAGEVGGLAALLRARFPGETPAQLTSRITTTAAGNGSRTSLEGYGSVQAGDAASRLLRISADGAVEGVAPVVDRVRPVSPPPAPTDRFAQFRTSLVWWGVLAGGGLVLALVLRPLRRR